jgi:hypothetical protein
MNTESVSATGAVSFQPGATPQEFVHLKSPALKARFISVEPKYELRTRNIRRLESRFQRSRSTIDQELAAASWNETAPLALTGNQGPLVQPAQ